MLRSLLIRDFAIIDEARVDFGEGFNVLTGETGAGKSIVIGALEMVLGARAHSDMIRADRDEAFVEAVFETDTAGDPAGATAGANGGGAVIRRRLSREGRGKITLGESAATLGQIEEVARRWVSLYGQHEYMDLILPARQAGYLDEFAGLDDGTLAVENERGELRKTYEAYRDFERLERERRERIDLLGFQAQELDRANPRPGEDEELESEHRILAHAEKIAQTLGEAEQALYSGEDSTAGRIARTAGAVKELSEIDGRLKPIAESLASAKALVQDAAREIGGYLGGVDFDAKRLDAVGERLYLLDRLKKKYGPTLDDVIRRREENREELDRLTQTQFDREEQLDRLRATWSGFTARAAALLSEKRKSARKLAREVEAGLTEVGLAKSKFEVEVSPTWPETAPDSETFLDEAGPWLVSQQPTLSVCYFFSANPGEPPRELGRVASGGERSRIMLVLKNVLSRKREGATLVFDEVDAGIGGAIAEAVGRKLKELSDGRQVICITHLPQIACQADSHFHVRKRKAQGRTVTEIIRLDAKQREEELARMLGGETVSGQARAYAAELLRSAGRRSGR